MLVGHLWTQELTVLSAVSTIISLYRGLHKEFHRNVANAFQLLSHIIVVDCILTVSYLVLVRSAAIDGYSIGFLDAPQIDFLWYRFRLKMRLMFSNTFCIHIE